MDLFLVIGIIVGVGAVVGGMFVKGANIAVLLNPAAAIIILVGTMAAVMNSFPKKEFLNIPKVLKVLFKNKSQEDSSAVIKFIIEMSQKARKDGLLSLEQEIQTMDNEFMKKGLSMVVDGLEENSVRGILSQEIESMEERHRACAQIFTSAGSYAPTLGVLGAVIGLIGALGNLEDVEKLGHMIAAAFVATLYGIFFGYVVCHPMATRLKRKSHEEISNMRIIVEGILSIQTGENPQSIKMKLSGLLEPKHRSKLDEGITEN
ncbi:chemotaxis protein MotA [Anaerobacterium chartisolvens]|uniref:Chemotaxis protein MotA n=1 Tax=Anaerobacterium chartisolvens TaxID=1297424 RepID=A0A369AG96_9FIRM|nr:flagellar motor stator protein MotA [Anaerobacterium chartisolvens]RCX07306.1 chemotaxis protein MotA [Anaerobacterium chartisolvens]